MKAKRRWRAALATAVVVVVVAGGLAALGLFLAPRVLLNLQTAVAEGPRTEILRGVGVEASLVVPGGWSVQRESDDGPRIVARTPDVGLAVTVEVVDASPAGAFGAAEVDGLGATARETTSRGDAMVHAEAPGAIVVAVAPENATFSVRLIARADDAAALTGYRAEIARLVDTVRVGS